MIFLHRVVYLVGVDRVTKFVQPNEDTPSMRMIDKTAYVGHRWFLPMSHAWRNSRKFNGKRDRRPSPRRFTHVDIQLSLVP